MRLFFCNGFGHRKSLGLDNVGFRQTSRLVGRAFGFTGSLDDVRGREPFSFVALAAPSASD